VCVCVCVCGRGGGGIQPERVTDAQKKETYKQTY
jgi:hypothetical protein